MEENQKLKNLIAASRKAGKALGRLKMEEELARNIASVAKRRLHFARMLSELGYGEDFVAYAPKAIHEHKEWLISQFEQYESGKALGRLKNCVGGIFKTLGYIKALENHLKR